MNDNLQEKKAICIKSIVRWLTCKCPSPSVWLALSPVIMNGRFYFLKIRHLLYLQRLTRVYNLSLQFVNYKTNAVGHILAQMIAD